MSFKIFWGNAQKTIIIHQYTDLLTLEDYHRCIDANAELLATVVHPVDLIIDVSTARISNQAFLSAGSHAERATPPNQRLIVAIQAPQHIRAIVNIGRTLFKRATANVHFVDTLEEAYRFIERQPVL
jgi:hypothetical protein